MDGSAQLTPNERKPPVIIKIEIDTSDLSAEDREVLKAVVTLGASGAAAVEAPAATPAKRAPATKAAPSPEPEPASEESPSSDTTTEALRDAVAARASELLSSGQRDTVVAALKGVGAGRVSEVEDADLQAFLDAIA